MTYDYTKGNADFPFTLGCHRSGCDMLAAAFLAPYSTHSLISYRAMPTKYHAAQQELVHLGLTPESRKMYPVK